ncbi:MAG TPA: class I SAM-dependent methyltransferase [Thermoanaerobaculia bacterium]|nr:class I SAM-dependent methyltransferase [Thermoanaerobaculia bacterium]
MLGARAVRKRFVEEFLQPSSAMRILDIGCGTGSLLEYLPTGVDYVGFDLNPHYIDAAREHHGNRGRFFCARVGDASAEAAIRTDRFDLIVAKGILHHLNDEDAHHLLHSARRLMQRDGVFVSSDNVFHEGQSWIAWILTSLDRGAAVRTPDQYKALAQAQFPFVETRLLTDMLPFPYSHFVMRARLVQS